MQNIFRAGDFGSRSEFEGTIPELLLKGNYKIDGKVLILPIAGEGTTEIKCSKCHYLFNCNRS